MKITLNIGSINYNNKAKKEEPSPECSFSMEASNYSFECEVGELSEVYTVISPIIKDIMSTLTAIVFEVSKVKGQKNMFGDNAGDAYPKRWFNSR